MDMIEELEAEFSALRTRKSSISAVVQTGAASEVLDQLSVGIDFVAGVNKTGLILIPTTEVQRISSNLIPDQSEIRLEEFLSKQRSPVRLEFRAGAILATSWLLSVQGNWLQVAASDGVIWVPRSALTRVWIGPVENKQQL